MSVLSSLCRRISSLSLKNENIFQKYGSGLAKTGEFSNHIRSCFTSSPVYEKSLLNSSYTMNSKHCQKGMATLSQLHRRGPRKYESTKPGWLERNPQKRAVVLKVVIRKPKKPNSANRKCVRIKLSNGQETTAYIPGEGHNLQEHHIVLVQGGRLQDVPGVKLECVRGKYDLQHVVKKKK